MKLFKFTILVCFCSILLSCGKTNASEMKTIHWDRDSCDRCNMLVSEKHFAVQVINSKTNKAYMFDDLGCAVLWFQEEEQDWMNSAKIWISDASNENFIDAKSASYTKGNLTPMAYGLSAYTKATLPENSKTLTFNEAKDEIYAKDQLYKKSKKMHKHKKMKTHNQMNKGK